MELSEETEADLVSVGTGFSIALYYTLARAIETKWPKAGRWLLGSRRQPSYQQADLPGGAGIPPALNDGDTPK